jgi:hypothetical protein
VTSESINTNPSGAAPDGAANPDPLPPAQRGEALERLLDLAYDVSSYLRHKAQPTIRVSAALLLAASLAACSSSPPPPAPGVAPLTQEVRSGLPGRPGTYEVIPETIQRDQQGVYRFSWREPGSTGPGTSAAVSLLKLGQGDTNNVVIPQSGDPVLNLTQNTPVQLAGVTGGTPTTQQRGSDYVYWRPFYGGGYYGGPAYYNPPSQTINTAGGTVDGSRASTAPPPAAARTVAGAPRAVSGQAGGTGSGTAATNKSGADAGASASGGGKSAAAAPASGGFSAGGKSGASAGSSGGSSGGSSAGSSS